MDAIRSTTWLISLGLHAGILVAIIGLTPGGAALESGTGEDLFVVEQGIAIEGVAKLGEAEEMIQTIDIPPVQQAQLKPPEQTEVPPDQETPLDEPLREVRSELAELITSKESKHEDPLIERKPEPILEEEEIPEWVAQRKPEPVLEKEEIPERVAERKPQSLLEKEEVPERIEERKPEPILEKEEVLEAPPVDAQLPQVATLIEKSSGQAQAGGDTTQRRKYLGQLRRTLEHNKVNPRSRQTGTVLITFTVGPSGKLLSRKVKKSSGSKLLDDAAIAALDRAAPFPPMPANVAEGPLKVQVPFKFITR